MRGPLCKVEDKFPKIFNNRKGVQHLLHRRVLDEMFSDQGLIIKRTPELQHAKAQYKYQCLVMEKKVSPFKSRSGQTRARSGLH